MTTSRANTIDRTWALNVVLDILNRQSSGEKLVVPDIVGIILARAEPEFEKLRMRICALELSRSDLADCFPTIGRN